MYTMFTSGSDPVAGLTMLPAQAQRSPMWLAYVAVADTDLAARRAVTAPPTDVPNVGRSAVLRDPTGATVAVLQPVS